jgi:hypothetical protein
MCIAEYALSRVIRRIHTWYTEWLGMVDRQCPAYHLYMRTPPPLNFFSLTVQK